ncbi:MAG: ABC transporter permease [Candidatus Promineifilaceae bacterium]
MARRDWRRLPWRNPVVVKELRSRMRGRRAFVILSVYLALMAGLVLLVYLPFASLSSAGFGGPNPREVGLALYSMVMVVQVALVVFIGPAFTAGAISGEKERQTYDLLRTTLLPARSLVAGKLFSALAYVLLLVFVSLPVQGLAFFFGGISLVEIVIAQLLIVMSALAFALMGLFFSTRFRSTLASSVATFAAALTLTIGTPVMAAIAGSMLAAFMALRLGTSWWEQALAAYAGIAAAATNLPATLIMSDVFLREGDSIFGTFQMFNSHRLFMPSPWYLFLLIYGLASLILFKAVVRRVHRTPDR